MGYPSYDLTFNQYSTERLEAQGEKNSSRQQLILAGLGLSGESGEFNDLLKKVLFHGKDLTPEIVKEMKLELGDILWYVMYAADALGTSLEEIAQLNNDKLRKRYPRGFTKGEASKRNKGEP